MTMARMDDVVSELRAITMGATHSAREKRRLSQAIRRQIRLDQLHSKNLSVVVYCRESCIKVHINDGKQNFKWLAKIAAFHYARLHGRKPDSFTPVRVIDRTGRLLMPHHRISKSIANQQAVYVTLVGGYRRGVFYGVGPPNRMFHANGRMRLIRSFGLGGGFRDQVKYDAVLIAPSADGHHKPSQQHRNQMGLCGDGSHSSRETSQVGGYSNNSSNSHSHSYIHSYIHSNSHINGDGNGNGNSNRSHSIGAHGSVSVNHGSFQSNGPLFPRHSDNSRTYDSRPGATSRSETIWEHAAKHNIDDLIPTVFEIDASRVPEGKIPFFVGNINNYQRDLCAFNPKTYNWEYKALAPPGVHVDFLFVIESDDGGEKVLKNGKRLVRTRFQQVIDPDGPYEQIEDEYGYTVNRYKIPRSAKYGALDRDDFNDLDDLADSKQYPYSDEDEADAIEIFSEPEENSSEGSNSASSLTSDGDNSDDTDDDDTGDSDLYSDNSDDYDSDRCDNDDYGGVHSRGNGNDNGEGKTNGKGKQNVYSRRGGKSRSGRRADGKGYSGNGGSGNGDDDGYSDGDGDGDGGGGGGGNTSGDEEERRRQRKRRRRRRKLKRRRRRKRREARRRKGEPGSETDEDRRRRRAERRKRKGERVVTMGNGHGRKKEVNLKKLNRKMKKKFRKMQKNAAALRMRMFEYDWLRVSDDLCDVESDPEILGQIKEVLGGHFAKLRCIFRYFASQDDKGGKLALDTMSFAKFMFLASTCKIKDTRKVTISKLHRIFEVANQDTKAMDELRKEQDRMQLAMGGNSTNSNNNSGSRPHSSSDSSRPNSRGHRRRVRRAQAAQQANASSEAKIKEATADNNPDALLIRNEFLEALVRIAILKFGHEDPAEGLDRLIREHVYKYTGKVEIMMGFRDYLVKPTVQRIFAAHSQNLIKLFLHYAAADEAIDGGDDLTISLREYLIFITELQIPNTQCSRRSCIISFAASQETDPTFMGCEEYEMVFPEFVECLARIANERFPKEKGLNNKVEAMCAFLQASELGSRIIERPVYVGAGPKRSGSR